MPLREQLPFYKTFHSCCRMSATKFDQTCLYTSDSHECNYDIPMYINCRYNSWQRQQCFSGDTSETDHLVNAQVRTYVLLRLLCDCYSGNPCGLRKVQVNYGFAKIELWRSAPMRHSRNTRSMQLCTYTVFMIWQNNELSRSIDYPNTYKLHSLIIYGRRIKTTVLHILNCRHFQHITTNSVTILVIVSAFIDNVSYGVLAVHEGTAY